MPRKPPKSKASIARQRLAGAAAALSDSEDSSAELGVNNQNWQWIYADEVPSHAQTPRTATRKRKASEAGLHASSERIVGARNGSFECRVGDTLLLKAGRGEMWVAIVCEFLDAEEEGGEKSALFMWFVSPAEIVNKAKRRTDVLPNELYITNELDENPMECIEGKATVLSPGKFQQLCADGKIGKRSKELAKTFVCRAGCNSKTATYTKEFVWEDIYAEGDNIGALKERIALETKTTRKRKSGPRTATKDLDDFVVNSDSDGAPPKTPRKRQKSSAASTPHSKTANKTPRKFTTPTHKRIITKKPLEFTPLGTRVISPSPLFSSPFQIARSQLHISAVPLNLPCREEEFSAIYSYLESSITDGIGTCIYISGTPGTGKTATVREVIAQLNASVLAEELDDFIFVEINGMKVTDPHQSYALLWEALTGDRVSTTHAVGLLEREFSQPSPRRVPCVVLMDELDQLVTKSQSVMYNFFNWPNLRHSRLIVLAVANTMDLPERTLSNKISSRLGLKRITFSGYTHDQLIKIIQSRLEGVPGNIVDPDAIQFASRKVAQVSGDARRALDICRRAVEIAEAEASVDVTPDTPSKRDRTSTGVEKPVSKDKRAARVTIATVQRAIREATSSPLQQYLRGLPLASKVFLAAILARTRRTGVAECLLGDVVEEAKRIGNVSQLIPIRDFLLCNDTSLSNSKLGANSSPSKGKLVRDRAPRVLAMGSAAMDLVDAGVVVVESKKSERTGRVRLTLGEDEVKLALKDDVEVRSLGFSS